MKSIIALILALITVLVNGLVGHYLPPNGIFLTPLILTITTSLVCFGAKDIDINLISFLTFIFIALNDILLKLYAGGRHDNEGQAWIHFMRLLGLIPTIAILLTVIAKRKEQASIKKITSIFLFTALLVGHMYLFTNLGIGRYY